jgi:hypothetical protein
MIPSRLNRNRVNTRKTLLLYAKKYTTGRDRDYKIGDLDQAMKELDRALSEMNVNMKIDFSKMDKEMKIAMDELKKVDFDKIGHEVAASLKKIDWDQTKVEVERAMREVRYQPERDRYEANKKRDRKSTGKCGSREDLLAY